MRSRWVSIAEQAAAGAVAGTAGALAMLAMRAFDQKYAPKTVVQHKKNPAFQAVARVTRATTRMGLHGELSTSTKQACELFVHLGYGALAGAAYGATCHGKPHVSSLADGAALGAGMYAAGPAAWLPLAGVVQPVWKQSFPEVGGAVLRHVAFGITTVAVYSALGPLCIGW